MLVSLISFSSSSLTITTMKILAAHTRFLALIPLIASSSAFTSSSRSNPVGQWSFGTRSSSKLFADANDNEEAGRLKKQAEKLRAQIRDMEASLGNERKRSYDEAPPTVVEVEPEEQEMSLKGKTVLVAGSNGRLGSMVCRYLLRNNPQTQVVAAVHYVGENSPTARGYGRLAYEVGAEDGVGTLGPAWSSEDDRNASFEWTEDMRDYNLQNLRLVECEYLDPVQCRSVVEGCDAVIWCATDFNGNQPRAISGLNIAFLFRAVTVPDKGRVEIEGLQNMLGALKQERLEKLRRTGRTEPPANDPMNFVLVSTAPEALNDFETPFGSFIGLKRQGEEMMKNDFPSLKSVALQMGKYEDNFVEEGLEVIYENKPELENPRQTRKINRRDAAQAAVDALTREDLVGKTVQVYTALR